MDDQTLHHFMQDLIPMVIGITFIVAMAWVIGAVIMAFKHRAALRAQAELYNRLLEKFSSAGEFVEYLQSDAGRKFFEDLTVRSASPVGKILGSIQKGVIITLLGIGLLVLGNIFDNSLGGDFYIVIAVLGTLALMLGIGFLISSAITYRLSKSWGLLAREEKLTGAPQVVSSQPSEL